MNATTRAHEAEMVAALGAAEYARRQREDVARAQQTIADQAPLLAAQGFRSATSPTEPGARFEWLRVDDRTIDNGLCKVWVVPILTQETA